MTGPATFSLFARPFACAPGHPDMGRREDCPAFLGNLRVLRRRPGAARRGARIHRPGHLGRPATGGSLVMSGPCRRAPRVGGRALPGGNGAGCRGVQLAETVLLNHITLHTSVATKAARCVRAVGGEPNGRPRVPCTQGIEAALPAARASAIAGFSATSNTAEPRRPLMLADSGAVTRTPLLSGSRKGAANSGADRCHPPGAASSPGGAAAGAGVKRREHRYDQAAAPAQHGGVFDSQLPRRRRLRSAEPEQVLQVRAGAAPRAVLVRM